VTQLALLRRGDRLADVHRVTEMLHEGAAGILDPRHHVPIVERDETRTDVDRRRRGHHAVLDERELRRAAPDVDVEDGFVMGPGEIDGAAAVRGE
jgi:hypothetical protein